MTISDHKSQHHQHYYSEKLSKIPKNLYNSTSLNLMNVIKIINSKPILQFCSLRKDSNQNAKHICKSQQAFTSQPSSTYPRIVFIYSIH